MRQWLRDKHHGSSDPHLMGWRIWQVASGDVLVMLYRHQVRKQGVGQARRTNARQGTGC